MEEYNVLVGILANKFVAENQDVLKENKPLDHQYAKIINNGIDQYKVYRFDFDECGDFLPFFNKRDGHIDGLSKFCDYIILASKGNKLYILLVELKSGDHTDAKHQIDASEVFMSYITNSAIRVCKKNGIAFDEDKLCIRRIVVKPYPRNRAVTNVAKKQPFKVHDNLLILPSNTLPMQQICMQNIR